MVSMHAWRLKAQQALLTGLCLLMFSTALTAGTPPAEIHHYLKTRGRVAQTVTWLLKRSGQGYALHYTAPDEKCLTITGPNYGTRSWTMANTAEDTDLMAERNGDTITLHGRFKGRPLDKSIAIDDAPWYQATSLSLRGLIESDNPEQRFWTIRTGTLTAHKIRAAKAGIQKDTAATGQPALMHVRLSLTGLLTPFWASDYWFSLPDGVFYRFEGPGGPPGTPDIVVQRQPEAAEKAD